MKIVSVVVWKPGYFEFFQITQDLNQTKNNPKHPFVDNVGRDRVQNFSKKYSTLRQLELFNFLEKIPSFSKTTELYLSFCMSLYIT